MLQESVHQGEKAKNRNKEGINGFCRIKIRHQYEFRTGKTPRF